MNKTSIGWTDFTSNPIRYKDHAGKMVWGCERTSPGCAHCYAADLAVRYGRGAGAFTDKEMATYTPYFDEKEARHILTAKVIDHTPVAGSKVFIGDMTDIFGKWVPDELLDQLFAVMALRHDVTFQVLTKRAARMRQYITARAAAANDQSALHDAIQLAMDDAPKGWKLSGAPYRWPLPNVWLGTSVENQHFANERIPQLLLTPAAVRFISAEPLLERLNLRKLTKPFYETPFGEGREVYPLAGLFAIPDCDWDVPKLDWGILGGESGGILRDPGVESLVSVARDFINAGLPLFVKQDVHRQPGRQGRIPDGIWALKQFPLETREQPR